MKIQAKSALLGINEAKNNDEFKRQMQRNFTKSQRTNMGMG